MGRGLLYLTPPPFQHASQRDLETTGVILLSACAVPPSSKSASAPGTQGPACLVCSELVSGQQAWGAFVIDSRRGFREA